MPHIITTDDQTVVVETLDDVITHLAPSFGPEGYATRRSIDAQEVTEAYAATDRAKRRVRVYSAAGFVPMSYKYDCQIQFVEAERTADDDWRWSVHWGRAHRSNARATRKVVQ